MPKKKKTGLGVLLRKKKLLAVNIIAVFLLAWGFVGEYVRSRDMQSEIDRLETEAVELREHNEELALMSERYSTSSMLEREARMKLNMKMPGEEVVVIREADQVIMESQTEQEIIQETEVVDSQAISNIRKWYNHFFPKSNEGQ